MTVAGQRILQRFELLAAQPDRGLGEAWSARDTKHHDRTVLVKLFRSSAPRAAAWEAVGRDLSNADTQGVARYVAHGVEGEHVAVVYESVEGRSLWSWIEGWRQLSAKTTDMPPQAAVQTIVLALLSAILNLHGKSVTHRALNPRSVMLHWKGQSLQVTLLDVAVAPCLDGGELSVCAPYLPPERPSRKGAVRSPTRDDLFAIGVITTELHTLRALPGEGRATFADLVQRAPTTVDATLAKLGGDLAAPTRALIARVMDPSSSEAQVNATALRRDIQTAWKSAQQWIEPADRRVVEPPVPTVRTSGSAAPAASPVHTEAIRGFASAERRSAPPTPAPPPPAVSSAPPPPAVSSAPPPPARTSSAPPPPARTSSAPPPPARVQHQIAEFSASSTLVDAEVQAPTDQHPIGHDDDPESTLASGPGSFLSNLAAAKFSPGGTLDLSADASPLSKPVVKITPARTPRGAPSTTLSIDQMSPASTLPLDRVDSDFHALPSDGYDDLEQTQVEPKGARSPLGVTAISPRPSPRPRAPSPAATMDMSSDHGLGDVHEGGAWSTLGPGMLRPSTPSWPAPPPVAPLPDRPSAFAPQADRPPVYAAMQPPSAGSPPGFSRGAPTVEAPGLALPRVPPTRTGPSIAQIALVVAGGVCVGALLILWVFSSS